MHQRTFIALTHYETVEQNIECVEQAEHLDVLGKRGDSRVT